MSITPDSLSLTITITSFGLERWIDNKERSSPFQTTHIQFPTQVPGSSQPPMTPVPGDPVSLTSSDTCIPSAQTHTQTHTSTHNVK